MSVYVGITLTLMRMSHLKLKILRQTRQSFTLNTDTNWMVCAFLWQQNDSSNKSDLFWLQLQPITLCSGCTRHCCLHITGKHDTPHLHCVCQSHGTILHSNTNQDSSTWKISFSFSNLCWHCLFINRRSEVLGLCWKINDDRISDRQWFQM